MIEIRKKKDNSLFATVNTDQELESLRNGEVFGSFDRLFYVVKKTRQVDEDKIFDILHDIKSKARK